MMKIMDKYFLLTWRDTKEPSVSAFAPKLSRADHELIGDLNGINQLSFNLNLVKLSNDKNGLVESNDLTTLKNIWLDYLPNNLAWPIMSEQLKLTIESQLTGNENMDWITVMINSPNEQRPYYIPRFNVMPDVLDMEKTIFVDETEHILKPVFSSSKISLFSVFPKSSTHNLWKITPGFYVSENVKKAIQKLKLTGLDFSQVPVS